MEPKKRGDPLPARVSLVGQTVDVILERILSGYWKGALPSERKLCAFLQVGRNTLRLALKNLEGRGLLIVNSSKRRQINSALIGKGDKSKKVVGILSPSSQLELAPRSSLLLDSLRSTFARTSFSLKFHVDRSCYSTRPGQALNVLLNQNPANIWLLISSKGTTEKWFLKQKVPCMVIGSPRPDIILPSLDIDFHALCYHAGGVLLRKGHRKIALVMARDAYGGDADVEQGLRDVLGECDGIQFKVLRHKRTADHICSLVTRAIKGGNASTAFIVVGGEFSLTVTMHLLRCGLRIPEDVAIISTEDRPILKLIKPSITRYTVDPNLFAKRLSKAARQLAESGVLPATAIRLMPEFLPGDTV